MESILSTFGIDWRLLVINIVNFGILLLGLWYFLYGPVISMLEERKRKIAEGVAAADKAQKSLMEIETSRDTKLAEAAREADEALAAARAAAAVRERELVAQAQARAESIMLEAQAQAAESKSKAIAESKQEVAKLVVLGIEKVAAK